MKSKMKRLAWILAAWTLAAALLPTAGAIDTGKNIGTLPQTKEKITIDGKKDTIYDQGLKFAVDMIGTETAEKSETKGTAYFLWDGAKTFYAYVEVKDSTMVAWNEESYKSAPWNNDSVELFFDFKNDGAKRDQYRIDTNNKPSYYDSKSIITDLAKYGFDAYACVKTANGYNVEFQVSSYAVSVAAGAKIGIDWQVNDMMDATKRATIHYNSSLQAKGSVKKFDYIVLGSNVVSLPKETAKPAAAPAAVSAPKTADASVVLAAVIGSAAAAVLILKKKH